MKILEIIHRDPKATKIAYIFCLSFIGIGFIQLVFSTMLATNVYHIAELKRNKAELEISRQILQDEIYWLSNLDNVDKNAKELGMIPASKYGFIYLKEDKVLKAGKH